VCHGIKVSAEKIKKKNRIRKSQEVRGKKGKRKREEGNEGGRER
jgi:hypothetical protein